MSFCTLCGAGFQFVGEHRPGCQALAPMQEPEPASSARGGLALDNAAAAETADLALEGERLRRELTEATALLAQPCPWCLCTRAPAQPAAPTPLDALFGAIPDMPLEPAAPEPSADHVPGRSIMQRVTQAEARAESAEAQLAAALKACDVTGCGVDDLAGALIHVRALLTPAPAQPAAPREPTIGPDARHPVRPAAPTPDDEGPEPCPLHVGQDNGCTEPAAPEPSAVQTPAERHLCEQLAQEQVARKSAEAQLAAARTAAVIGLAATGDSRFAVIRDMLTTAPSSGAGEKT